MKRKILDVFWFGRTGIVKVETEFDEVKYYVGIGKGIDTDIDKRHIAMLGSKIDTKVLIDFLKE